MLLYLLHADGCVKFMTMKSRGRSYDVIEVVYVATVWPRVFMFSQLGDMNIYSLLSEGEDVPF